MGWGTLGSSETLEGASGRSWTLRFERRLAPRENSKTANPASSVWLVRDETSARLYAAKRQTLASLSEVDALVDEAAAWRAACLADTEKHIVELVDVFVDRDPPYAVTFLAEFCSRGLLPKRALSEPVLLTLAADLARAASAIPDPHAHISYESLLVDDLGRIRLAGFGAHRSAILRDNPGLTPSDDSFDIGLLLYELMFGAPPPESLQLPETSAYSPRLTDLVVMAFSHPHPQELFDRAVAAGAEPRAPVVDIERTEDVPRPVAQHVTRATERNVDRLATGVDIAPSFAALLNDLTADPESVAQEVFAALFKKPVSKDPLCAMRIFTMLHNLLLDGPESVIAAIRKNDKFMDWAESSWTREAIETAKDPEEQHKAAVCFAGGELAFYAALLRRKARFHMLAAGGFSGRWDRTGVVAADGRDVLTTRRRKVISGMADVIEMASELGCRLAAAVDEEAPVKHTALGALLSECCLAFNAALELTHEIETVRDAEKVMPGIGRLYMAARALVFAVEHVPSAGGEHWVEQFAQEAPPDIVDEADRKERAALGVNESGEFPEEGWAEAEALVDEEVAEKKRKKKERKRKKEAEEQKRREEEAKAKDEAEITAEDGALVVHGADEAAAKVQTMFGDLLAIDDGNKNLMPEREENPRPTPNMSNAQALASAFGVPEETISGQHAALPAPEAFGDEYDDEGGYEDYRARQEQNSVQQARLREGSNTAAWAARAGYGERAVVVSGNTNAPKKSHPVVCQCALCQQEEAQAAAKVKETQANSSFDVEHGNYAGTFRNDVGSQARSNVYGHDRAPESSERMERSYYDVDNEDSLDGEDEAGYAPQAPRTRGQGASYYHDDYDSYESVTYSVEDDGPKARSYPEESPTRHGGPTALPGGNQPFASQEDSFTVDRKLLLNAKRLRIGDKISDTPTILVSKGEYNRETVAVKKLTKAGMASDTAMEEFTNEVKVTLSLTHPRLLKCIAASLQKPNIVLVTEFMKRGTLFDVLHKSRIKLTWALIRKIALQLAEGMGHMHENGMLHRDLKSLNIFADGSYNIKVGDFGLSCHVTSPQGPGISGTYQYMAPEVLRGEPHTFKSDVFSYGRVLCEMVSGVPPFQSMDARAVAESVVNEDLRPPIPPTCQRAYINLIQMCWGTVPSTRPSFPEIVQLINSTTK